MVNSRQFVRIEGPVPVALEGDGGRRAESVALDVSRSGALIKLPEGSNASTWERARIQVSEQGVSVVVGLVPVRHDGESAPTDDSASFLFVFDESEEERRLERFIRTQFFSDRTAGAAHNLRALPRIECRIHVMSIAILEETAQRRNSEPPTVARIVNMSPDGAQLVYEGVIGSEARVRLSLSVPGDSRPLILEARVAYEYATGLHGEHQAGVSFSESMTEIDRARVRNFILSASAWGSLRSVYRRLWAGSGWEARLRVEEPDAVSRLLTVAADRGLPVNVLAEDQPVGIACTLARVVDGIVLLHGTPGARLPAIGTEVDCSFSLAGGSYYYRARVVDREDTHLTLEMPAAIVFTEKRNAQRTSITGRTRWRLQVSGHERMELSAVALDSSSGGISLQLVDPAGSPPGAGVTVTLQPEDEPGVAPRVGEVRNVEVQRDDDGVRYRLGIEFGTVRIAPVFESLGVESYSAIPIDEDRVSIAPCEAYISRPVEFHGPDGRSIVALLNATRLSVPATVVIVPPAFGKRKEALAPLAGSLLATYRNAGRDVVVVRFDGTDRPGESANRLAGAARGYEMLDYTISQGRSDLEAAIRYALESPLFTAEEIVLATFSMSSLDARRLLAESPLAAHVSLWVSVMGVPAAKNALIQTMGGLDVVSNYTAGLPSGVCGLLGHLLDMDQVAADLIANRYAYLSDARADMARIDVPVLWLYGMHDRWVQPDEVDDIMSVRAEAPRAVVRIPAGHNLRTSDEALRTFRLIASVIRDGDLTRLRREGAVTMAAEAGRVPQKEEILAIVTHERERLSSRQELDALDEYWRRYLIGSGTATSGYDFYGQLGPFVTFLDEEVSLLAPNRTDSILDAGCGTGLWLESLFRRLVRMDPPFTGEVVACDLVPAALERARTKVEQVQREAGTAIHVGFRRLDLEPNRLIPLVRYLDNPAASIESLRGRVEGLSSVVLDQLEQLGDRVVRAIISGERPSAEVPSGVAGGTEMNGAPATPTAPSLSNEARDALADLALAARFHQRRLRRSDLSSGERRSGGHDADAPLADAEYGTITAADLNLRRLTFRAATHELSLPLRDHSFDAIMASLFISYLFNVDYLLEEFHRILKPGGRIVVSSMRPDSDISVIFTDYVAHADQSGASTAELTGARQMLSEAAALFELEEEGFFRFYSGDELASLLENAGFLVSDVRRGLGDPHQAVIAVGKRT